MSTNLRKDYHECEVINLGSSDIASLTIRSGAITSLLKFGEDGAYSAYLVDKTNEDKEVIIPDYYELVFSCENWLKIYDDNGLTFNGYGCFNIYRCGNFGCIIEKVGE